MELFSFLNANQQEGKDSLVDPGGGGNPCPVAVIKKSSGLSLTP